MSKNVRVVVANRPRLMRELLLATIADQPDIEVVAEVQDDADIARVVEEKHPTSSSLPWTIQTSGLRSAMRCSSSSPI